MTYYHLKDVYCMFEKHIKSIFGIKGTVVSWFVNLGKTVDFAHTQPAQKIELVKPVPSLTSPKYRLFIKKYKLINTIKAYINHESVSVA